MVVDIRKLVNTNLSIKGLTFAIIAICFALCITPKAPVVLNFNFRANLRAFKSSNNKRTSSNSAAKAIALASPRSTCVSRNFWYFSSETDCTII